MTGIGISDACVKAFEDVKTRKSLYATFVMAPSGTEITVGEAGPKVADSQNSTADEWNAFTKKLLANKGKACYGVFDVRVIKEETRTVQKLLVFSYIPDDSKIKDKMLYAGSTSSFKERLNWQGAFLQATDASELTWEVAVEKALNEKTKS